MSMRFHSVRDGLSAHGYTLLVSDVLLYLCVYITGQMSDEQLHKGMLGVSPMLYTHTLTHTHTHTHTHTLTQITHPHSLSFASSLFFFLSYSSEETNHLVLIVLISPSQCSPHFIISD